MPLGLETDGWNEPLAIAELARVMQEIEADIWRPPGPELEAGDRDPTFHEFASFWLAEKEADIGPSTYEDYYNLLTRHLLPEFRSLRLSEIDYERIARYRAARVQLSKRLRTARDRGVVIRDRHGRELRPFGPRQINASIALLARILDRAKRSDSFDLAGHPARERDLKVKRDKPDYRRYLEADEILDLLDAALEVDQRVSAETVERAREVRRLRDDLHLRWADVARRIGRAESTAIWLYDRRPERSPRARRCLIAVLGLSGLRANEAATLRWRHIDFSHTRIVIADAKTVAGVREVHLSAFLRDELLVYRASLGDVDPDGLVFSTKTGTTHTRQNLNRRVLVPVIARAADRRARRGDAVLPPRITPQALRRSFVTLCAQLGRSAAWVQSQIGHADMTTMQRYYLQASMSEIDPRMRGLVDYLLGEGQPLEPAPATAAMFAASALSAPTTPTA